MLPSEYIEYLAGVSGADYHLFARKVLIELKVCVVEREIVSDRELHAGAPCLQQKLSLSSFLTVDDCLLLGVGEELVHIPADVPISTFRDMILVQPFIDIDRFESC